MEHYESSMESTLESTLQAMSFQTSQTPRQSMVQTQPESVAYQAATPYPPIKVTAKNPRYAAAMLDNMGGQISEMSAVALYFYNHLITSDCKEVADTFHHISIVEMHHLEIFGSLALLLGENPRLWSRRGRSGYVFWSPGYLRYPPFPIQGPVQAPVPSIVQSGNCDSACAAPIPCPPTLKPSGAELRKLLAMAVEGEEETLKKYLQQASWIQDPDICDNLRRIAADEQMHIDILTRLYHQY